MLMIGMDTSGKYASCGLCEDGRLLGEVRIGTIRAHSQMILPMAKRLTEDCGKDIGDIDGFAVVTGPGSYTGLRIGIGAVKGLCFGSGKPCGGVSALEAIAANFCGGVVCAVMHARQELYYGAFFEVDMNGNIKRLGERDRIIPLDELAAEARELAIGRRVSVICAGEGCEDIVRAANALHEGQESGSEFGVFAAPENMRMPCPAGICRIAERQGLYEPEMLAAEYMQVTKAEKDLQEARKQGRGFEREL